MGLSLQIRLGLWIGEQEKLSLSVPDLQKQ